MKVGVHVPQWGSDAGRDGVLSVARAAEEAGLDSVWVADHVVYPLGSKTKYPYGSGETPFAPEEGFLDAFVTLAVSITARKISSWCRSTEHPRALAHSLRRFFSRIKQII